MRLHAPKSLDYENQIKIINKTNMNSKNRKYNWLQFAESYIDLSLLSCESLISANGRYIDKYKDYDFRYIVIPILYNLKHGIEIFIKTLQIILNTKENKKEHNVKSLLIELKRKIRPLRIVAAIEKELKKNPNNMNAKVAKEMLKNKVKLDELLDSVEKIILKYYHCEIIKNKLVDSLVIEDTENTAFRYPDNNRVNAILNYDDLVNRIKIEDIQEIFKDAKLLREKLLSLGFILNEYKKVLSQQN